MKVKLTKKIITLDAENQQEADKIWKFLFEPHADLLWMNGAGFSTDPATASMVIRKLSKLEKDQIKLSLKIAKDLVKRKNDRQD